MHMMRSNILVLFALLAFGWLAKAGVVHVDVSRNGNVAVDIDTKQQQPASAPKLGESGKPVHPSKQKARVLDENQVNLGYEVHQGFLSDSRKFLSFKNIPYAEPPVGNLRFFEPLEPQSISDVVNNGSVSHICPQTKAGWVPKAQKFLRDFSKDPLSSKWAEPITPENYGEVPKLDERANEDCLLLDVMVHKAVWDARNDVQTGAAVIVWIHGGGFVYGSKDQYGSPEGLFDAAEKFEDQNIIYVAINYRLGAFGWLGSDQFIEDGGVPNLGLYDQNFALRITVAGQNAGAASIMHHITASGGDEHRPTFTKAILQSPEFFPRANRTQDATTYTRFLELTGAKDLEGLQELETNILMEANAKLSFYSIYGTSNFGPTIDGLYVRDLPGILLKEGKFHSDFSLMIGHNNLDGLFFTPPWIRSNGARLDHIRELYPSVPDSVLTKIEDKYPVSSSSSAQAALVAVSDVFDDITIQCNNHYLTEAWLNDDSTNFPPLYRYSFNALPAVHGYDIGYTFYPSQPPIEPVDATLAKFFQNSIVNFARFGDPTPEDNIWNYYGPEKRRVMNLGAPGQSTRPDYSYASGDDLLDRKKCDYWQTAPYYAPPSSKEQQFVVQDNAHYAHW